MRRLSLLALIAFSSLGNNCPSPTPKPAPKAGSWLVLLCKASDDTREPHPKSFYEELFSKDKRDLVFDYFQAASNEQVDVSGTEVYGWFSMMVKTADIAPAVRNNGMPVTRNQTARDCRASALGGIAATGISVNPADYAGVITVINVPVDWGAAGEKLVVFPADLEVGFIVHEMLHENPGLDHSLRAARDPSADHVWSPARTPVTKDCGETGDLEYCDCWDIMSYATCTFKHGTARGPQGPELQGAYRERVKWLPEDRVQQVVGRMTTVALAPVSEPTRPGPLLAKIEIPRRDYYVKYVVEYREKSRFDAGIPKSAVVIREQRNKVTYLVQRQDGRIDWQEGDTFTDTENNLRISVDDIVPGAATITVDTAYSSTPPGPGEWCGNKYRGEVLACPAGTVCGARRTGILVSEDHYCLP